MHYHNPINWNGTIRDSMQLAVAVERHCACDYDEDGVRATTCAPHRMLTDDERALNGLLFARHILGRLLREEHGPSPGEHHEQAAPSGWPAHVAKEGSD